jgi:hypothetical protein
MVAPQRGNFHHTDSCDDQRSGRSWPCASMSRPGGNITGVSVDAGLEIWGKRLELFREIVPTISKLAILGLRHDPFETLCLPQRALPRGH